MLRVWALTACALLAATRLSHAADTPATVAVDLSGLGEQAYSKLDGLGLEKRILLRLVQDGFAVVAIAARPDVTIRLHEEPGGIVLEAAGAAGPRRLSVALPEVSLAELHLEIAQKVVELARASLVHIGPPPEPTPEPSTPPPPAGPTPLRRHAPARPTPAARAPGAVVLETQLGADLIWRTGGADALARLTVRLGLGPRFALHLEGSVLPASVTGLDVLEWEVAAGLGVRLPAGPVELSLALLAGVHVHHYTVGEPAAVQPSGDRRDALVLVPAALGWRPWPRLRLELRVAAGVAEAREHRLGGQVIWHRGARRLAAGLGLAWNWR